MIIGISGKIGSGKDTVGKIIQMLTRTDRDNVNFIGTKDDSLLAMINLPHPTSDWQIKKFAYAVKQVCSILTGIPVEDFEKEEVKNRVLGEEWDYFINIAGTRSAIDEYKGLFPEYHITIRELLQQIGTNAIRDVIHPNAWINALMSQYKWDGKSMTDGWVPSYSNPDNSGGHVPAEPILPNWIITDVRFPNEAQAIKDRGGILIRIESNFRRFSDGSFMARSKMFPEHNHPSETALDTYQFDHVITNNHGFNDLIEQIKVVLIQHKIL